MRQALPYRAPATGVKVQKAFKFGGKPYATGQDFPWRQVACSERKLRQLIDGRYLVLVGEGGAPEKAASKAPAKPAPKTKADKQPKAPKTEKAPEPKAEATPPAPEDPPAETAPTEPEAPPAEVPPES